MMFQKRFCASLLIWRTATHAGASRHSPTLFHSCYLIFIVLVHSKAKEGEGQSSGSRKHHALCDHLPNTSLMSWRGAMLAGCTGSIHIANCVMSSRTTTRFFLHLMVFDHRQGERKGRSGQWGWKGKAHTIVRAVNTNCPCAKDLQLLWQSSAEWDTGMFNQGQKALWIGKLWQCPVFPL